MGCNRVKGDNVLRLLLYDSYLAIHFVTCHKGLISLLDADDDGAHVVSSRSVVLHVGPVAQWKRPGEPAATRDDLALLNIQHGRD
jgi:hypothetical protein